MLPTLQTLVNDYLSAVADARDAEVLNLFSTLFKQMGSILNTFL